MSAHFQHIVGMPEIGVKGVKKYVENFTAKAAKTEDPVERLLLQQVLLLNQRIMQLCGEASSAKSMDAVKIYNSAAARLSGEFRRMVMTLRQYRAPLVTKTATFVKMQALAEHQNVHFADHSISGKAEETIVLSERTEVEGNASSEGIAYAETSSTHEKPEACNRWQDQRLQAAGVDR